jgi:hypothetical protein
LQPPKEAERLARAKAIRIALDCFEQQLFSSRCIFLNKGTPAIGYITAQGVSKPDLGVS